MRNLLRRDRNNLERRLRDERPAPSDELVRRLSGSTDAQRAPRRRFGLAIALTSMIVVAFALTGGIGYAASSASKGTKAVKQLVTGSPAANAKTSGGSQSQSDDDEGESAAAENESSAVTSSTERGSARRQYQENIVICHKPRRNGTGRTIRVSARALPTHLRHGDYLGPCRRR
jgi:hypothetical protein